LNANDTPPIFHSGEALRFKGSLPLGSKVAKSLPEASFDGFRQGAKLDDDECGECERERQRGAEDDPSG
jgi:hypothetical protein